jgi:alpha-L-fucosidase
MTRLFYFLINKSKLSFGKRGQFSALFLLLSSLFASAQNDTVRDDQASGYNLNRPARVEWFRNTGAGLFIHFSVDAQLGIVISHSLVGASDDYVERYFNQLPKTFDPARFSPREIAVLAKLAGMKYIVFTTKHHSGFCMWDTRTSPFNIMNTPYHKDLLQEFVEATRAEGVGVGFYFSPEDFWFLHQHQIPISRTDVKMADSVRQAYDDYTRRQCEELMTRYGRIDVLFIDGTPKEVVKSTCWRLQPDLLITRGAMKTPEQVLPGEKISDPWLSCITMGTAWQYQPTNERYKSGNQLIRLAIEARAKGGSLLLNVGPKADGSLPAEQEDRLREMAAWYFINHECMDSVRSWVVSREDDIWFTARDTHTLYAIVISEWKEGARKTFSLHSVKANPDTRVSILGQNSRIIEYKQEDVGCRFRQTGESLELSVVKAQRIYDDHRWPDPVVIKLENICAAFEEAVDVRTLDSRTTGDGVLFSGKVFGNKRMLAKRARFYYRPYAGQVETLYSAPWAVTGWTDIEADGTFHIREKKARPDKQYEYRAVVEYCRVEINGEDKVYRPAPARIN